MDNSLALPYDKYGYWDSEQGAWIPYDDMGGSDA